MFTRTLSVLGLALCATAPGLATPSSAAPTTPTIAVTAQVSTVYLSMPGPDETFRTIAMRQVTLHITGSGFAPGSQVRIAVMTTAPWKLVAKGSTYAQDASIAALCPSGHEVCSQPNPGAGTIDYRLSFSYVPAASNLAVLYRSARHTGIHDLSLTQQ